MSFSINTNIASLEAQNYLQQSVQFQNQTINEVTSGLRIVNSGDDAAGLAIANGLAADQAVLTQGIQNANDGIATLQTIDGGLNNISQLLDRADTLATESASSTFTGNRSVLDSEFQSVLSEINRQAQSVGLNSGGAFAQNLNVFIGGGRASGSNSAIQNGSVSIDLSSATVDTQSLGLSGYSVQGNSSVDIGTGGGTTSVSNIIANTTNQASETQAGNTTFYFTGAGFANTTGADRIAVSVNLNGVTDANSLANAINSAIQSAGNGSTQQATAFKNAGITASVYTNASGQSSLQFTSSSAAFQVEAGDQTSNALLGNISSGSTGQSVAATTALATGQANVSAAAGNETVNLAVQVAGQTPTNLQVSLTAADSTAQDVLNAVNSALSNANAGVTASLTGGTTGKLQFTATNGNQAASVQVLASGDTNNYLGLGSFLSNGTSNPQYTSITATGADFNADTQDVQIAIGNQLADLGSLSVTGNLSTDLTTLNNALQGNTLTKAAGITAVDNNGAIELTSSNSTAFRLNVHGQTNQGFGFGVTPPASGTSVTAGAAAAAGTQNLTVQIGNTIVNLGTVTSSATEATALANINSAIAVAAASNATLAGADLSAVDNGGKVEIESTNATAFSLYAGTASGGTAFGFTATAGTTTGVDSSKLAAFTGTAETGSVSPSLDAQGTSTSGFLNFQGFTVAGNSQTVSLTAPDSQGAEHAISFSLSSADAGNIDAALSTINTQLQDSNDSTLQQIVAVKDQSNGADGIRFISSLPNFDVSLGTTATGTASAGVIQGISNGTGTTSQGGTVITSSQFGTGATADISTLQNAENAITALGNAVTTFGNAQAAVGKGENLFTYATNLAQSQVTSEAASESGIKDANLAEEASNLSKAQILVQAGTAALAQANSAPQAILSLLKG